MVAELFGGVGLFLLGMALFTDGLKAAAGESLRRALVRFAGGPVSAFFTGAGITALVQSSSATTVATIGFVSAGLLSFPQALGVVFGANLGTTSTGWVVSLLGLKLSVAILAMPLVGAGALMRLLLRGRGASVGLALAGFGLIFLGIDALQSGMKGLAETLTPATFPDDTVFGRLLLAAIGLAMTVIVQSSSAAVAMTLTALHAGRISLEQAAALVIGENVGTTVTAVIASIGGSVAAKRTALAHVLFNLVTGIVAFAFLPLFVRAASAIASELGGEPGATSLAAFHTAFNLFGVAMFLPFTGRFAALVSRLVRERGPRLTRNLDASTTSVPSIAVEVARRTVAETAALVLEALCRLLRDEGRPGEAEGDFVAAENALAETGRYLAAVRSGPAEPAVRARHISTLHAIDHVGRLIEACKEARPRETVARDDALRKIAGRLALDFAPLFAWLAGRSPEAPVERAERLSREIADMRRAQRPEILARTAAGELDPESAEHQLEAMRWIDRLAYHTWRAIDHLKEPPPGGGAERAELPHEDIGAGAPR
jgi:phosphate:Na+ symporter